MRCSLPPKAKSAAGQGNAFAISTVLIKPQEIVTTPATTPEDIQQRRLAKLFFLSPDVAATIARLHFGEARA
jgi:hypothetical protein